MALGLGLGLGQEVEEMIKRQSSHRSAACAPSAVRRTVTTLALALAQTLTLTLTLTQGLLAVTAAKQPATLLLHLLGKQ